MITKAISKFASSEIPIAKCATFHYYTLARPRFCKWAICTVRGDNGPFQLGTSRQKKNANRTLKIGLSFHKLYEGQSGKAN